MILKARFIRADICSAGCPMVVLCGADGDPIAEAHILLEHVEQFIAQLREAAACAEGMQGPKQ